MNQRISLKFLIIVASILAAGFSFLNYVQKVKAENLTAGPLTISYPGAGSLFSEMNIVPGDDFQKTMTITNNGTVNHSFSIATKNVTGNLADKLYLQPHIGGNQIWSASVSDLAALPTGSKMIISSIAPGNTQIVDIEAILDDSLGNAYQGQSVKFDLIFGSEEAEPANTISPSTFTGIDLAVGTAGTIRTFAIGVPPFTPQVSATAQASQTAITGEVKGEQTGGGPAGEEWRLLLIVPALGILSTFLIASKLWRAIIIPIGSGIGAFVLSYFFKGTLATWIFYLILAIEIIIFVVLEYYIRGKQKKESEKES